MENLLNQVIKSDVRAREKLKEAEAYRKEQMESLPQRKEQIIKEENQKAIDEAMRRNRSSSTTAAKKLEQTKARNRAAEDEMEKLYSEKCDEWVETMLSKIIEA
ncbi:MAG: hypothetical protein IJZ88_01390 [Clostridia bacterium]|nr:hypothetical protein [Clostridia bacterium]